MRFLKLFEAFFTSYDVMQRQNRRQFMYDFKKITKISSFCYLKMAIYGFQCFPMQKICFWGSWDSLKCFWRHTTLHDVKNDVNLCMILRKSLNSRFLLLEMANIWISMFSIHKIRFWGSWDCSKRFWRHTTLHNV